MPTSLKTIAAALLAASTITTAHAATIESKACSSHVAGCYVITIDGEIKDGDYNKFVKEIDDNGVTDAIVVLNGPGGLADEGLAIGREIQTRKFTTWVGDNYTCASICGSIWLAGSRRFYQPKAMIGFHACFQQKADKNGSPDKHYKPEVDSGCNALQGAYYGGLGLSYKAIYALTATSPTSIYWLKLNDAKALGIEVEEWQEAKQ